MEINYGRASTLQTYDDCEFRYFLQYCCELDSPAGKKAALGTLVHLVLEILAKAKKTKHYLLQDKYTDPKYLLDICWKRFVSKTYPEMDWNMADYKSAEKWIMQIFNSDLNPLNFNIFAIENQFDILIDLPGFDYQYLSYKSQEIESGKFRLRGTIDLVTQFDEETLWVYDWKTGERKSWTGGGVKELEDFQEDLQLRIYDLALSIMYPQFKYRMFTIVYIRDGGPFTVSFDSKEKLATIDELRKRFYKIQKNYDPRRIKTDPDKRDQLWKCKYVCHFGKSFDEKGKNLCDKYYSVLNKHGINEATEKLYQLSISGSKELSRRNDYSRANIVRGVINNDTI